MDYFLFTWQFNSLITRKRARIAEHLTYTSTFVYDNTLTPSSFFISEWDPYGRSEYITWLEIVQVFFPFASLSKLGSLNEVIRGTHSWRLYALLESGIVHCHGLNIYLSKDQKMCIRIYIYIYAMHTAVAAIYTMSFYKNIYIGIAQKCLALRLYIC